MKVGPETPREAERNRGFTLIELMLVITILFVLAALAAGRYEMSLLHAKEAALTQDLSTMNEAIRHYTEDKQAAPTSLDDLVQAQYLGRIPNDPVTGAKDWVTETCDTYFTADQLSTGICAVHAGSDRVSPFTNTPYSSW